MSQIIVSHNDADGIICVALTFIKFPESKFYVYFATPSSLKQRLCKIIMQRDVNSDIFLYDLTPTNESLYLAGIFSDILWIDHHEWDKLNKPSNPNIKLINDPKAESNAKLVAKHFKIKSELVEIANQIDKNNVKTEDAEFLRDAINAVKHFYMKTPLLLNSRLKKISVQLALSGIDKLRKDLELFSLIEKNKKREEKLKTELLKNVKTFEINNKKVAIYETMNPIPSYVVLNKLKEHPDSPFDIIIVLFRQLNPKTRKISTKIELRTHTDTDVVRLAKLLGGGGHRVASGASFNGILKNEDLIQKIREIY